MGRKPGGRLIGFAALALTAACGPLGPTGVRPSGTPTPATASKAPSAGPSAAGATATPGPTSTGAPTGQPTGGPTGPLASATPATLNLPAAGLVGRVLGLDGTPAAGVLVRVNVISDQGGSLISVNGSGVLSNNGGGVVSNNGGSLVGGGGSGSLGGGLTMKTKRQLLALDVRTGPDGRFALDVPAGQAVGVEAVQSEELKAIKLGVVAGDGEVELRIAYTGSIAGRVSAPSQPGVTDFEGVAIFVPGTSYAARADKDGRFTLTGMPVGAFELVAMKDGLGTARAKGVAVRSRETTTVDELALTTDAPTLTALSATQVKVGDTLRLSGERFGASAGKPFAVTIGGAAIANPVRLDDRTIEVVVPAGTPSGDVTLTVGGVPSGSLRVTVLKPRAEATVTTVAGGLPGYLNGTGAGASFASAPSGIAVGPDGAIYVADRTNLAVRKVVGNVVSTMVGPPPGASPAPDHPLVNMVDLAFDGKGRLLVLDQAKGLFRVEPGAAPALTLLVPANVPDGLQGSMALAIGPDDMAYVVDQSAGPRILKVDLNAAAPRPVPVAGGGAADTGPALDVALGNVTGLAAGPGGELWFVDNVRLRRLGPDGQVTTLAGANEGGQPADGVGAAARFASLADVARGPDGTLYVAENGYARIRGVTPVGVVTTLAGVPTGVPGTDGPATSAVFGQLTSIAVDASGNVVVFDSAYARVRRLTLFDP